MWEKLNQNVSVTNKKETNLSGFSGSFNSVVSQYDGPKEPESLEAKNFALAQQKQLENRNQEHAKDIKNITSLGKESINKLKLEVENNTNSYIVRKGDTIAAIAMSAGISTEELVSLNDFVNRSLVRRWKNVIIHPDQIILVPKDKEVFLAQMNRISEYSRVADLNEKVRTGRIDEIEAEPIFASSVQSIWFPNVLSGFIKAQQASFDPNLPHVVDRSRETHTTCANYVRTLMSQSMNIADISHKEQAFQNKEKIDAWMLPAELKNIGFEQKFGEIMDMFNPALIVSSNPIKKEKLEQYRSSVKSLNTYLENSGNNLIGSFVPYYFKYSDYKKDVTSYNKDRGDKHYNTHQSIFAGNTTIEFGAWNVPLVRNDKMVTFGADKKNTLQEIERLKKELPKLQAESENTIQKIISVSNPDHNQWLTQKLARYNGVIDRILQQAPKPLTTDERHGKEKLITELLTQWNATKQPVAMEALQKAIPWYKITLEDITYLGALVGYHRELATFVTLLQKAITTTPNEPIDGKKFGMTIAQNDQIQQAIDTHNSLISKLENTKSTIITKEALLKKPQEGISVIDFILNFIQSRLDFKWSLGEGSRTDIYNGLAIYGDTLHIKINGKNVDIMDEYYKQNKKDRLIVSPEDRVEISGPMMIDGEKQATHSDVSRQEIMNGRTRFFFEFFLSGIYLPTELLVPWEESSYKRRDFPSDVSKLTVKGAYSLRMKYDAKGKPMRDKNNQILAENIEEVLLREIVTYEKLNPDDPEFKEKLRGHYALQIKALQIAGFLQNENTLNKSAVNINRTIPYFDAKNIKDVFTHYIKDKKQERHAKDKRLSSIKTFIDIQSFPGDAHSQIFAAIIKYIETLGDTGKAYPYIAELARLEDYKKRIFMERFLLASRESWFDAREFLKSPKPDESFRLQLDVLNGLSRDISEITYTEKFSGLRPVDQKVIELATSDVSYRNMLSNILAVESYGDTNGLFSRRNLKKLAKNFGYGSSSWDYQLRIPTLLVDLDNSKTLGTSLDNIFRTLSSPETESFLGSLPSQSEIRQDLGHIEAIKKLLSDTKGEPLPRKLIAQELSTIMRFDSGDGSNVVSKLVSASLLIDKLALHSEKLNYMLQTGGYNLPSIFDNPTMMRQYERTVIRTNNLPENHMLLALTENFIIRLAEYISASEMPTKTVFNESLLSKGKYLGQIRYDKEVFLEHLRDYRKAMKPKETDKKVSFFLEKLDALIKSIVDDKDNKNTNTNIYAFLRDKDLRSFLKEEDINASLLPLEEEWRNNAFTRSVFNYVNKITDMVEKTKVAQK